MQTIPHAHVPRHPDRSAVWSALEDLRACRADLGLSAQAVRSLEAILGFLADPARPVVHASNRTICARAGICDRSLRRHVAELCGVGLLRRVTSANGKRFRLEASDGTGIAFGLDVTPFLRARSRLAALAAETRRAAMERHVLRHRILARLRALAEAGTPAPDEAGIRRALRRRIDRDAMEAMLAGLPDLPADPDGAVGPVDADDPATPSPPLSVAGGQDVRLHLTPLKEERMRGIEDAAVNASRHPRMPDGASTRRPPTLQEVREAFPKALAIAPDRVESLEALLRHAWMLGRMMGIPEELLRAGAEAAGRLRSCLALLHVAERFEAIRSAPAYYRSLTTGPRAAQFHPFRRAPSRLRAA